MYNYHYKLKKLEYPSLVTLLEEGYDLEVSFKEKDEEGNPHKICILPLWSGNEIGKTSGHYDDKFFVDNGICSPTKISFAKLTEIFPLIDSVVIREPPYKGAPGQFEKILTGVNWTKVVNLLSEKKKVQMRGTEHEFRGDHRNLVWVHGFPLKNEVPVDSLGNNEDCKEVEAKLLQLSGGCIEKQEEELQKFISEKERGALAEPPASNEEILKKITNWHKIENYNVFSGNLPEKGCFNALISCGIIECEKLPFQGVELSSTFKMNKKNFHRVRSTFDAISEISVDLYPGETLEKAVLWRGFCYPRNRGVRELFGFCYPRTRVVGELLPDDNWMFEPNKINTVWYAIEEITAAEGNKFKFSRHYSVDELLGVSVEISNDNLGSERNILVTERNIMVTGFLMTLKARDKNSDRKHEKREEITSKELEYIYTVGNKNLE